MSRVSMSVQLGSAPVVVAREYPSHVSRDSELAPSSDPSVASPRRLAWPHVLTSCLPLHIELKLNTQDRGNHPKRANRAQLAKELMYQSTEHPKAFHRLRRLLGQAHQIIT